MSSHHCIPHAVTMSIKMTKRQNVSLCHNDQTNYFCHQSAHTVVGSLGTKPAHCHRHLCLQTDYGQKLRLMVVLLRHPPPPLAVISSHTQFIAWGIIIICRSTSGIITNSILRRCSSATDPSGRTELLNLFGAMRGIWVVCSADDKSALN